MVSFEQIVGYTNIKKELMEIVDIIKNPDVYKALGAKLPRGAILVGDPGMGKTMLATAFIAECGLPSYKLHRSKSTKDFLDEMNDVFKRARVSGPSVILLDDVDKFAVEDRNSTEFSALQSLIDSLAGADVFVIATANDPSDMPSSLLRPGRFDRYINVTYPSREDSASIAKHYIGKKPVSDNINLDDVANMLAGKSCAELDNVINEAAIQAAHERCDHIEMRHMISATLREAYGATDDNSTLSSEELEEVAYHEAGHAALAEIILEGSVGLVSLNSTPGGSRGGFMLRCKDIKRRAHEVIISLGGKAGSELKYGRVASGTFSDLRSASSHIDISTSRVGTYGLSTLAFGTPSQDMDSRQEIVCQAELERHLFKAKEILCENMDFFEKLAGELIAKGTLLSSDVARIRSGCVIKATTIG